MRNYLTKYRPQIAAGLMVIGGLLMASFTISHNRFTSSLGGLIGTLIFVGGFVSWSWPKLKSGDTKAKKLTTLLGVLLFILLILDIIQWILD